jgi:tetratricopeptide (TPR) repeat protein
MKQPDNPRRLGDFEIVRELGRGGMGVVYEARQVSLNRKVALKVLSGGLGLTGKAVQRFRREAEAAAKLHHTNIVPVYATGEQDDSHFYAMELIEGPSLDHVIRQLRRPGGETAPHAHLDATGPYVPVAGESGAPSTLSSSSLGSGSPYFDTVARMVAEVADALEYAHQQGVIHRDIKPSNLLLSPQGRLSVNDFGLARVLEQPGMTLTGEFVGTPAYTSPEQITAGRIPLDHRTDIYSLGATLYELLTLQPPFRGQSREQVLAQIVQKEPRPPRKLNRKVPVDLETICLKALEKDPDRRYQTAGAMAEDLRRYVNRFAIEARRAGPLARLVKWVRRRPGLAAALAFGVLAGLAAGFFAYGAHLQRQRLLAAQEQHEQQLREEKRQNVLDKAQVAAMGGDFEGAAKAIAEAEILGASTGQVRMLRGYVALHRGETHEAIDHLQQAVALLPDSVAARSSLAFAYRMTFQWDKLDQTMRDVEQLTPRTPEDFLFKGRAISVKEPQRGLDMLREAIRQRPSFIAHLYCAEAGEFLAEDLADPAQAEPIMKTAVNDAEIAKQLLPPGNVVALSTSLRACLLAADIYGDTGQPAKRDEALARAREDARALKPFATVPIAFASLEYFLKEEGQEDVLLKFLRDVSEQTSEGNITFRLALALFRRQELTASLAVIEKKPVSILTSLLRPVVLADQDGNPTRALVAYQELAKQNLDARRRLQALMILRLLGDKKESESRSLELSKEPDRFPYFRRESYRQLLDYAAGKLSSENLLAGVATSRTDLCEAHFCTAITLLAQGDRVRAREHFHQAIKTHVRMMLAWEVSWAFLGRMEADPTWPSWIPPKK